MKKLLLGVATASLLSTGLFANGFGVDVGTKVSKTSGDTKVLGIQKVSELVGDGGTENFIEGFYQYENYQVGTRFSHNSSLDEQKLELTWKINLYPAEDSMWFINGGFGFGKQAGQTKTISTNITRPDYIANSDLTPFNVSTQATIDDSTYTTMSIGVGVKHDFTENFTGTLGYEFERKYWDVSYTVAGKESSPNDLSGFSQNFHGVRLALIYKF